MPKLEPVATERLAATEFNKDASDFEKLSWACDELQRRINANKVCEIRKQDNTGLQNRLIKLIGTKRNETCHKL